MNALSAAGSVVEARVPKKWRRGFRRVGLLALVYLVLGLVGVLSPIWVLGLIFWWEVKRLRDRLEARRLVSLLENSVPEGG